MEWPSDSESEVETVEVVPCADPAFREHLLEVKHDLYERVIYGPEEGTKRAQDLERLQEYLKLLNRIYLACVDAQQGRAVVVESFPPEIREGVRGLLVRMDSVYRMPWEDRIPYGRMVEQVLREDPFVQM